jgi:S1-C subfamily serine protease
MKLKIIGLSLIIVLMLGGMWILEAEQFEDNIFRSIVKIRSVIPDGARTAGLLGTMREGNGVIISADGLIVTTGYLILEAEKIKIDLMNGMSLDGKFVGYDFDTGFGLLRVKLPESIGPLKLGLSAAVSSMDPILVASYGGKDSARAVFVVNRRDFAGYWEYLLEDAIYTSPPIRQYGGAALIGSDGSLLGIGSLFARERVSGIGVIPANVFIPIDKLKPLLADLDQTGNLVGSSRPWMGLYLNQVQGRVIVLNTSPGGPAEQAGLTQNDIVLQVRNHNVTDLADFYRKVWALGRAGVDVPLKILHGSEVIDLTIHSVNREQFFNFKPGALTLLYSD